MNPIDKMLLKYGNQIEIRIFVNPEIFDIVFSSFPSTEMLTPLLNLIETERFQWDITTKLDLFDKKINELLCLRIEQKNVIPVSEAIKAITEMWKQMGYDVTIKIDDYYKDRPEAQENFRALCLTPPTP